MIDNIISALKIGNVSITFTSLTSGREITDVYTLKGVNMPQNPTNEKLIVRHLESNTYEDIDKNTIISWYALDKNS